MNYEVPSDLLIPYLPAGVELDLYEDRALVSLVGLMFCDTKLFGLPDPLHHEYEQVNLRFYVRHTVGDDWHHGSVFIKEIVPAALVTAAARLFFNENYTSLPMMHHIDLRDGHLRNGSLVEYQWRNEDRWNAMRATIVGEPSEQREGSPEAFVAQRLYGYTRMIGGGTMEYALEHPRWDILNVSAPDLDCDVVEQYGAELAPYLGGKTAFSFVAAGSPVSMIGTRRI
jgi:uncharacterized protein YqjF (DUF2071 family)